jgi:hypothetical protein
MNFPETNETNIRPHIHIWILTGGNNVGALTPVQYLAPRRAKWCIY